MERLIKMMVFLFFAGSAPMAAGANPMVDDSPQRHDAEKALAQLHEEAPRLGTMKRDLALAQQELVNPQGKVLTFDESKALQDRIQVDMDGIRTVTTDIYKNLNSTLVNWSHLTQEEKDFIGTVELLL